GTPGSFEVAHFHPRFDGVEPCPRVWDETLTAQPWQWLEARLRDLPGTLAGTGRQPSEHDAAGARLAAEDVAAAARGMAATRCGSVTECHERTRDVTASVRLMIANLKHPDLLDRRYVAPWVEDAAA